MHKHGEQNSFSWPNRKHLELVGDDHGVYHACYIPWSPTYQPKEQQHLLQLGSD